MAKILPVFLPFASCGNKCVFCDQVAISGVKADFDLLTLANNQFEQWLNISDNWDEVAFFGGNFSAIDKNIRESLYKKAYDTGIKKIRFSTRPDTINNETISEIKDYNISLVELGIQSLDEEVLLSNARPYNKAEAIKSIEDVLSVTECGIQLMNGMYKQSYSSSIDDAAFLSKFPVKTARIYPTQVLRHTGLDKLRIAGLYKPTELEDIILATTGMFAHFMAENINVIRMGLPEDAKNNGEVTAGASHPAFGDIIKTMIMLLYMNMNGKIFYSGYKKAGKVFFEKNEKEYNTPNKSDIYKICKEVRSFYLEDSKRFLEGQATSFARYFKN